ncbi:MAG: cytochrome-c oxidase, cbb3-type subunit III [Alphaproteobacteria bacterium]|nr:cytochrome-c oxidase, cbb3-type subunit III [Alphaproteobacteria bacterium]
MTNRNEIDKISGVETTGHDWDGIKELNNPLPRWWILTFYATIAFSIGYMVVYPSWPTPGGGTKGLWGWSSRHDIQTVMDDVAKGRADVEKKISSSDINAIMASPELKAFAVSAGGSAFKVHCAACHGAGAQGAVGYPNLNDDDWLWGGKPEQIVATIAHGVRSPTDSATHTSQMPAFGRDGVLDDQKIAAVTQYVLKLAKLDHDEAKATAGAQIFTDNCAACHGANGEGNQDMGAPRLSDQIWLYKGTAEAITAQVTNPRHGVMPAWEPQLGPDKVKELAAYVISLGGSK